MNDVNQVSSILVPLLKCLVGSMKYDSYFILIVAALEYFSPLLGIFCGNNEKWEHNVPGFT